jgi:uncharacterized protein YjhX (UPF0386 family)
MGPDEVVVLGAAMSPAEVRAVERRVAALLAAGRSVVCDVRGCDLAVVDALARARLVAARAGEAGRVRARGLERLAGLLELAGLAGVVEVGRDAEAREQ